MLFPIFHSNSSVFVNDFICTFLCAHLYVYICFCSLQLLQHGSTAVLYEPDLIQVMEAVERRGVKELSQEAAQTLRLLLTQVH